MRKHQFVKQDCNCLRKATYFTCKHCGAVEYCSLDEVRALHADRATCMSENAPSVPPADAFRSKLGGCIDCLAPDYDTWDKERKDRGEADPKKR